MPAIKCSFQVDLSIDEEAAGQDADAAGVQALQAAISALEERDRASPRPRLTGIAFEGCWPLEELAQGDDEADAGDGGGE